MATLATIQGKDIINVTEQISQLMTEEISLLQNMQLTKLKDLQQQKEQLLTVLEHYKQALKNDSNLLGSLSKDEIAKIKSKSDSFEAIAVEGQRELMKAKKVHEVVMGAIKRAVTKRMDESYGYNGKGFMNQSQYNVEHTPAVSLCENV